MLSKKGDLIQVMASYDTAPENFEDISMAIATLYGVTSATSGNIPELLYGDDDQTLFRLANLRLIDDARLEDGTMCIRLRGKDINSDEITVWVGKDSYLIQRIEEITDAKNSATTTYKPEVNIEIIAEEMILCGLFLGEGLGGDRTGK